MKRSHIIATAVGGAAGLALVGGIVATALPQGSPGAPASAAADAAPQAVVDRGVLGGDALVAAAQAGLDEAQEQDQQVSIAVVDRSGATRLVLKTDNAGPQTQESAEQKAFTAVSFGQPTSALSENAGGDAPSIGDIPGTLFLAGGVPVASDGAPIAGIGVGGAPDGSIDEEIAQAALDALENYEG
ncbi:heme-binding protein [Nocardiopsis sp. RSe5-2]|uniref:Heme-binding protein n=1 Tax=Nocardiopsis endophytica TaxID=3018445 RepID=A0ABT4U6Z5_9ACTN|nr:heme-binding protein [Nocardiopsis endophytica]MDA2812210.1 heme-binding protein [Nocardiopsis endophytica]